MTEDRPRRPILSLKPGARVNLPDFPAPPPAIWKCRPCGAVVEVAHNASGVIRCGACNARLGKAEDFLAKPPLIEKLRARPGKKPPAPVKPTAPAARPFRPHNRPPAS
ncbi:MAG: hypothetical protein JO303_01890 [Caulobacteraceae bacterium]|nr:hypothetical protein [Caulobacteraceae bacterium]